MSKLSIEFFRKWGSIGGRKNTKEHMRKIAKLPRKIKVKSDTTEHVVKLNNK